MTNDLRHHLRSIATLSGVLTVLTLASTHQTPSITQSVYMEAWSARVGSSHSFTAASRRFDAGKTLEERIAKRLQHRLRKKGNRRAPPISNLIAAVETRQFLLGRTIDVEFETEEGSVSDIWTVSAQRYPLWVHGAFNSFDGTFSVKPERIRQTLETEQVLSLNPPQHAVLRSIEWKTEEGSVSRAQIEGIAKPGYLPDLDRASREIANAFVSEADTLTVPIKKHDGRIINMTGRDLGDLRLWATGRSNYKGSTYARSKNVQKALNQHVTNTVVAPGETFAFNDTLDGAVSVGNGWHMAKVIFNGGDLEYAPGGGICQASTTVYRAIVNAGFPVLARRAHSIYVSYYKEYGVGIDATIYPGTQDLVFENDSKNHLLIQSYNDGDDAYVNIYGTPDGRTVALNGPFFQATAPAGFTYRGRGLHKNEIGWSQTVTYPNGEERTTTIGSRYKTLPQHLVSEYPPEEQVHAAAPEPLASVAN